ncbi:protein DOG1-like 3 [Selaginella moellendorffii]|uniref:protein DOG1-like 3 n=1 Tax=Selaginella moellendorffii TaxID=88036 RepID=UPI000D1C6783|nr:protein DOG1-like 3 [Selaginella moellendorffii]XP_024522829.1 protein DOG1-like 3 [Selaginella moellendorffii]XP_024522830.1 protein DOG1-like 3 [Selaginella moellendorffii]XP_024522831.1 protein DOG1-like 3 [Selaginella moellendorffii]|eukprot:XP_024522828.1 protein DOG1-like 3 [Selaginella moellendorffii]
MASRDFEEFHKKWFDAASLQLKSLRNALKEELCSEELLIQALEQFYTFYRNYAEEKIQMIKEDASHVVASCWRSPLEISFLWMGGWRPTMSVILVFSLMGMQIEDDLVKILEGMDVPTMAALSGKQLQRLNSLQQRNRHAEDNISNHLADLQMLVADQEITRATVTDPPPSESDDLSLLQEAMEPKLAYLRDIVLEAEELRLRAADELVQILTPLQAVQYAVTALELGIAVRKLGVSAALSQHQCIRGSALEGNVNTLRKVLARGADPSAADSDGRTALHMAASKGHSECVDMLINAGANVNKKDNFGMTPLLAALKGGHDVAADLLVEKGAEPLLEEPGIELCKATASGDVKYVERLVKHGVDPSAVDYAQNTPLHIAAAVGSLEAVAILVNEGADVLAKDRHGHTPLDEARDAESEAAVKIIEEEVARRRESESSNDMS